MQWKKGIIMKLNNKGLTLIELILSFTILALFVVAMLETVLSVRRKAANELFAQDMVVFKNTLLKTIQDDLLKNEVLADTYCEELTCHISLVTQNNANVTKIFTLNQNTKVISYDDIQYEIPNKNNITFGGINMIVETLDTNFKMLIIDISYYEKNTIVPNYGFRIAHPIEITPSS